MSVCLYVLLACPSIKIGENRLCLTCCGTMETSEEPCIQTLRFRGPQDNHCATSFQRDCVGYNPGRDIEMQKRLTAPHLLLVDQIDSPKKGMSDGLARVINVMRVNERNR